MMLLSVGIRVVESRCSAKLCDAFDETVEFANSLLGGEPKIFEC